jgi:hypothetical protein
MTETEGKRQWFDDDCSSANPLLSRASRKPPRRRPEVQGRAPRTTLAQPPTMPPPSFVVEGDPRALTHPSPPPTTH